MSSYLQPEIRLPINVELDLEIDQGGYLNVVAAIFIDPEDGPVAETMIPLDGVISDLIEFFSVEETGLDELEAIATELNQLASVLFDAADRLRGDVIEPEAFDDYEIEQDHDDMDQYRS